MKLEGIQALEYVATSWEWSKQQAGYTFWSWNPGKLHLSPFSILPEKSPLKTRFLNESSSFRSTVLVDGQLYDGTVTFPARLKFSRWQIEPIRHFAFPKLRSRFYPNLAILFDKYGIRSLRSLAELSQLPTGESHPKAPIVIDGQAPLIAILKGFVLFFTPLVMLEVISPQFPPPPYSMLQQLKIVGLSLLFIWPVGHGWHLAISGMIKLARMFGKPYREALVNYMKALFTRRVRPSM